MKRWFKERGGELAVAVAALVALVIIFTPSDPVQAQQGLAGTSRAALNVETIGIGSQPAATTSGQTRQVLGTLEGIPFVRLGGSNQFTCRVTAVVAATQCQAAPGAGLKAYVTDVIVSNNVGTAQTIKLVTGTGAACATGVADLTHAIQFGAAVGNFGESFQTPLQPPAAAAICVTPSAATSVSATVSGYIAP